MFEYIKGKITEKKTTYAVIDIQGIGYKINIPITTSEQIGDVGTEVKLFTYLDVKENDLTIYGFHSSLQREVFQSLIKVSGIGAKIAISVLSGLSIENLISSIAEKNVAMLTEIPGVGKKTAQRLIVELKDSFADLSLESKANMKVSDNTKNLIRDSENALISLGYNRRTVKKEIRKYLKNNKPTSSEVIVKNVIKSIHN